MSFNSEESPISPEHQDEEKGYPVEYASLVTPAYVMKSRESIVDALCCTMCGYAWTSTFFGIPCGACCMGMGCLFAWKDTSRNHFTRLAIYFSCGCYIIFVALLMWQVIALWVDGTAPWNIVP